MNSDQQLDIVTSFNERLGRMEADIRTIMTNQAEMRGANLTQAVRDSREVLDKLELRVREVESFKSNITGRLIVIGVVVAPVIALISAVLSAAAVKLVVR